MSSHICIVKYYDMTRIVFISFLFFSLFNTSCFYAQSNVVTSGNDINGVGGTVSFTVGQIDYTTKNSSSGIVTEGVQQPFEILVITGIENTTVHLQAIAYPNPTVNQLTLRIDEAGYMSISYILTDLNGKILEEKKINAISTEIQTKELAMGVYFLKVVSDNKEVKVFKIIKN